VTSEHCRGQEPQERRPVDHGPREARPLVARAPWEPCTRPDRRRRLGLVVPERAVAGRCVEAQADVARPSRGRLTQRGPARQPDDPKAAQANTAARSSGSVSERRPNARTRRTTGSVTTRTFSGEQSW